ncbi:hypothetical protein OQA88_10325 [Cercophora sp. LCS_1]
MEEVRTLHSGRLNPPLESTREEWEDWESDDEPLTPMNARDGALLGAEQRPRNLTRRTSIPASSSSRWSGDRPRRPTSRARQRAQNALAGITVITDMSKFRREQQTAQQTRPLENRESRTGRFVDAAALKALEGSASQESGGTFGWLKKKPAQSPKGKSPDRLRVESQPQEDLSPAAGPIMIGFAMPSDSDIVISPQTAVVETPIDFNRYFGKLNKGSSQPAPTSAWSPDSDDGPASRRPNAAEVMSRDPIPAVPSVPEAYRNTQASNEAGDIYLNRRIERMKRDTKATTIFADDDEDLLTPVTLFEEDGSPLAARKSFKANGRQRSTTVTSTRSQGWWDQVTTPFTRTPVTPEASNTNDTDEWWKDTDRKHATPVEPKGTSPKRKVASSKQLTTSPTPEFTFPEDNFTPPEKQVTTLKPKPVNDRKPDHATTSRDVKSSQITPRIVIEEVVTLPASPSPRVAMPNPARTRTGKAPLPLEDEDQGQGSSEGPPPYSPPSQKHNVKYCAFFPPEDPRSSLYQQPHSPSPVSPGLARTMTSQGAIGLRNIPLTPPPVVSHGTGSSRLPDRPQGSFVPSHVAVTGRGERQRIETQRRNHEKEDAIAYKMGGLWKGRGCFPKNGCFGRPGREGRRKRRICGLVVVLMVVIIALAVALPLTLMRRTADVEIPSRFLNLTDFPPMPTGIAAVVGTNSVTTTTCVSPSTFWSCSLPKEQASLAAPYDSSQPSFILHIQFDNSSGQLWNVPQGIPPVPTPVSGGGRTATPSARARAVQARGGTAGVRSTPQRRQGTASGFRPDPAPPSFQDIFFLGNTTDRAVSPQKAGEPTPFYISILSSLDESAGPNVLSRQARPPANNSQDSTPPFGDILPPPVLDSDGTAAPAVLLPFPKQQPVRLYDRGLPTERYAFYTYFDKRTFLKSILPLDRNTAPAGNVPADLNGGALKTEANFVITWLSTRYKVEIWTQRLNSTRFLTDNNRLAGNNTRPGTFPYPITITLDTHGGPPGKKFGFVRKVDERQRILLTDPKLVANDMNTAGDLINPQTAFNPSFGGMDGGTGGCKCEYTNFVGLNGQV